MALKASVDNLDEVPEAVREDYKQVGDKFVLTVAGLKPEEEFQRVYSGLGKERNDHKASKEKLAAWTALGTPEEVQAKLDRIAELEVAAGGKLDQAAIDKLVEGRIGTKTAPLQRDLDKVRVENEQLKGTIAQYQLAEKNRTIADALRVAAKKSGMIDSAFEDAVLRAERIFDVDESGNVVAKEGVGCTPGIDPSVWLTEMQQKSPHWWPASAGGGARGSNGGATGGENPWTYENWNMTKQNQLIRENPKRAEQLAASAGTSIGGMKPQPRK